MAPLLPAAAVKSPTPSSQNAAAVIVIASMILYGQDFRPGSLTTRREQEKESVAPRGLRGGILLGGVALGLQQHCALVWHVAVVARRFRFAAMPKAPKPWAQSTKFALRPAPS